MFLCLHASLLATSFWEFALLFVRWNWGTLALLYSVSGARSRRLRETPASFLFELLCGCESFPMSIAFCTELKRFWMVDLNAQLWSQREKEKPGHRPRSRCVSDRYMHAASVSRAREVNPASFLVSDSVLSKKKKRRPLRFNFYGLIPQKTLNRYTRDKFPRN